MSGLLNKIENSFKAAMKGQESTDTLIKWWGINSYLVSYFILERVILSVNNRIVDVIISMLLVIYFSWHAYFLKKCAPKKPKLSKEEKEYLKKEARKNLGKKILRKLLLQESITKWNPITFVLMLDLLCIAHFLSYVV